MDRAEISQAFIADRSFSRSSFRILEVTGDHERFDVFSTSSCRILEMTRDLEQLTVFSSSSCRILEVTGDHEQLDVFSTSSCRILEVTGDHERMYVSSTGDFFGYASQNHHNQVSILRPCSHNLDFYSLLQEPARRQEIEYYKYEDRGKY